MKRWISRLFRLSDLDAAGAVCDRSDCSAHTHPAVYGARTVSQETGEVRRARLCTKAAAMLAYSLEIPFPPGPKQDEGV